MAICSTKYHGELEYTDDAVTHFPHGLIGFESETSFLLIEIPATRPLVYLQSLSSPQLCFLTIPVFVVCRNYELVLSQQDLLTIDLPIARQPQIGPEVLCLVVLTVMANRPATANLMAPITINRRNSKAVQGISLNEDYSHQFVVFEAAEEALCS